MLKATREWSGWTVGVNNSVSYPNEEFAIDLQPAKTFFQTLNRVSGAMDVTAGAKDGSTASATGEVRFEILAVLDEEGQEVPYSICSALDLQY